MTMTAPVSMTAFLASLPLSERIAIAEGDEPHDHDAFDAARAAASDESTECSGCEHCDGEGGHSVADSKRAYASVEATIAAVAASVAAQVEGGPRAMKSGSLVAYLKGGKAIFTLVSQKTGKRFTFLVRAPKADGRDPIWFVSVLTGSNNESDYTYLGTINAKGVYRHGAKSPISSDAPSAKAFAWAWNYLVKDEVPPTSEFWHSGKCSRCSRALTDPASLEIGLGPICADR